MPVGSAPPPVTRTWVVPGIGARAWLVRAVTMAGPMEGPLPGVYSSVLLRAAPPALAEPPVTRTLPLPSRIAARPRRPCSRMPSVLKLPRAVEGSLNVTLAVPGLEG